MGKKGGLTPREEHERTIAERDLGNLMIRAPGYEDNIPLDDYIEKEKRLAVEAIIEELSQKREKDEGNNIEMSDINDGEYQAAFIEYSEMEKTLVRTETGAVVPFAKYVKYIALQMVDQENQKQVNVDEVCLDILYIWIYGDCLDVLENNLGLEMATKVYGCKVYRVRLSLKFLAYSDLYHNHY